MKTSPLYLLFSLLLGTLLSLCFYPISAIPFILSIGIFAILLKKYQDNLNLFIHGLFFGYGFFIIHTYWMPFSLYKANMGLEWIVPTLSILIPIPFAIFIGVFAIFTKLVRQNNIAYLINFAFLWVIFEYIRCELFFPFSWGILGYTAISIPWFKNILSLVGSYGTSLVILLVSLSLFSRNYYFIIFGLTSLLFISMVGQIRTINSGVNYSNQEQISIRIVQPNIQDFHFYNIKKQSYILKKLSRLTLSEGFEKVNYVFWPESAFPYPFFYNSSWLEMIKNFVPTNNIPVKPALIFGTDRITKPNNKISVFNSLVAVNKSGKIAHYDKRILVPFGEYMPMKLGNKIIQKIASSPGIDDFAEGKEPNVISLPDNISLLPLICSESTLDKRHLLLSSFDEYRFILNITNDAWFENTLGPQQHFVISRIKAIEYGMPVIRVANSGISAIISSYGEVLKISNADEESVIDGFIPPKLKKPTIFYQIHSFVFPSICLFYIIFISLIYFYKLKSSKPKSKLKLK